MDDGKSGIPIPPSKPKIWSLADTAVCKTPPPPSSSLSAGLGGNGSHHHLNSMGHQFPGMGQPGGMAGMGAAGQPSWSAGSFDRSMSAFRGNAFGMGPMAGMMGLPGMALGGHRPDFGGMMGGLPGLQAAAAAAAQLPAGSPGLMNHAGGNGDLQTDTPPHTPPTGSNKGPNCPRTSNSGSGYLYNNSNSSLTNGYSSSGNLSPGQVDPSKLLNFPGGSSGAAGHLGAFKMM